MTRKDNNTQSTSNATAQEGSGPVARREPLLKIDEGTLRALVDGKIKGAVEDIYNAILEAEAEQLVKAGPYERTEARRGRRNGHRTRKLQTRVGEITLSVPRLREMEFTSEIIARYRRRESSIEEALVEMYLAGVSTRRVGDITEILFGASVSPQAVSELNQKVYERLEAWQNRPLEKRYVYVYLDGMVMSRRWTGDVSHFSVLVAVGVGEDGLREVIGIADGAKEDKASWLAFLRHLKARGLNGVRLAVSDACLGLVEALGEVYPDAAWQRCAVHFYRNVLAKVPHTHKRTFATALKAVHAQESREAAQAKVESLKEAWRGRFTEAVKILADGVADTLSYYDFPPEHWTRIRTNNPLERLLKEVRRRTNVVGAFPDGRSALMLATARVRYVSDRAWSGRRYMDVSSVIAAEKPAVEETAA